MDSDELATFMVDNDNIVLELQHTAREIISLEDQVAELKEKQKRTAALLYRAAHESTAYYVLVDMHDSFTKDIDERVKYLEKLKALLFGAGNND